MLVLVPFVANVIVAAVLLVVPLPVAWKAVVLAVVSIYIWYTRLAWLEAMIS